MTTQQIIENAMPTRPSANYFNAEQSINKPETHDSKIPINNKENKGPILILSDSMLKGIKPLCLSRETYISKQCISGGNVTDLTEIVNNMDDQTRYRKVLLLVGTNSVFKYDQQTLINEIYKLIKLIQSKWSAEVIYSGIINKNDSRKNLTITKINKMPKLRIESVGHIGKDSTTEASKKHY